MPHITFDSNVFLNCPFDDDFKPLLHAIVFTVIRCSVKPKLALQEADANEPRIMKLERLIKHSRLYS